VTSRLGEIRLPTLVTCGWFDHVGVDVNRLIATGIPDAEFVIFGHSSHLVLLERERDAYLAVVRDFVTRAARTTQGTEVD
jgi:pimeloyl-ACP methyl ester carboxylesterase